MSKGVNLAVLLGNISSEVKVKYVGSVPVVEFWMATNIAVGKQQKLDPQFHLIHWWGPAALNLSNSLHMGKKVNVIGSIKNKTVLDGDGKEVRHSSITANDVTLLD